MSNIQNDKYMEDQQEYDSTPGALYKVETQLSEDKSSQTSKNMPPVKASSTSKNDSVVKNVWLLIGVANKLLLENEPTNISVDPYTKYSGYQPQYIVDAMNSAFGIDGWGFTEDRNEFVKDDKGVPLMALAQVTVWIGDKSICRQAYGQGRVTRSDYGDAKKSAQTDALKKALSYFSIGNRAFLGLLNKQ